MAQLMWYRRTEPPADADLIVGCAICSVRCTALPTWIRCWNGSAMLDAFCYVPTVLPRRYDAFLYIDQTTAPRPPHLPEVHAGEVPETFPSAV